MFGDPKMRKGLLFAKRTFIFAKRTFITAKTRFIRVIFDIKYYKTEVKLYWSINIMQ